MPLDDLLDLPRERNYTSDHPCHRVAEYWSLKILLELGGVRGMTGYPKNPTFDGAVLRAVGLGQLEDEPLSKKEFLAALGDRLDAHRARPPGIAKPLGKNLSRLGKHIGLSKLERRILGLAVILQSHQGFDDVADTLGTLSTGRVKQVLAVLLDTSPGKVRRALASHGLLLRSGILDLNKDGAERLSLKLRPAPGLVDALLEARQELQDILGRYFRAAPAPELEPGDFAHMKEDYRLVHRYLARAAEARMAGVNLLLYGPPGTGKTELVRTLAGDLGLELYEIRTEDEEGDPIASPQRFSSYQLSQQVLARKHKALILFDEIEDVFQDQMLPFFGRLPADDKHKAWVNRLLEENPTPAIWISNQIEPIDPAFIRRFDVVLELRTPPRGERRRILARHMRGLPVRDEWIQRVAENPDVAPALVSRAARVLSVTGGDAERTERDLERLLGHTLNAMGYERPLLSGPRAPTHYSLDFLNPDQDLERLVKGIRRHGNARICLYGPPGAGKTEFGRFAAKSLDRPLLLKRASDLLGPFVGMTEAAISGMFEQAAEDNAVLLLDEADSFLRDRRSAQQSWEVTQVNELLTQMEAFEGLFICATNLMDSLDDASLRRFDLKIRFDYLRVRQAWGLFRQVLAEKGIEADKARWKAALAGLDRLTPGDFATVVRQIRLTGDILDAERLFGGLQREVRFKRDGRRRTIGFHADLD